MSEMIERVARAIFTEANAASSGYGEWCTDDMANAAARAAIEAMREPTEAMIDAGDDICPIARGTESHKMSGGVVPEDYWRAMIDAVLSPPLAHGEASEVRDDR